MKLASIERIKSVVHHPNADLLDIVEVLNYKAIVKRDSYKEGELCVFIQPDTVLPEAPWSEFYRAKSKRVKAIKLRSVWSMGIVESMEILKTWGAISCSEGDEVSDILKIVKYEEPEPQDLQAKGRIPFGLPITDEENYQSLLELPYGENVDVTLKRDGKSWTAYAVHQDGTWYSGICGRKLEYKLDCANDYTKFKEVLIPLLEFARNTNTSLAIRGEITGEGVQANKINPHAKGPKQVHLFSTYLIDERRYAGKDEDFYYTKLAKVVNLPCVEMLEENVVLTPELIKRYDEDLEKINGEFFEGVIIKRKNGESFKVINKTYDSKK